MKWRVLEVATRESLVEHLRTMEAKSDMPQARRSVCADAALRAEMKRVEKMTVEERMNAALSMGRSISVIRTSTKGK